MTTMCASSLPTALASVAHAWPESGVISCSVEHLCGEPSEARANAACNANRKVTVVGDTGPQPCPGDLNESDLGILLAHWGEACP